LRIVTARRISQAFFLTAFLWFCVVQTPGEKFAQLGNWPVNFFLQIDPLAALGTVLTTHRLYAPLLWSVATIVLTVLLGRFFCGWVCPFGTVHQLTGFAANRGKPAARMLDLNRYRKAQSVKYLVLVFLLGAAAVPSIAATCQIGLLDPICLMGRSVNLAVLPIVDGIRPVVSPMGRFHQWAWVILAVFCTAVLLNLYVPRFYCRFVCPLGALFGVLCRFALWRIGAPAGRCKNCSVCGRACEGACEPGENTRLAECVLCFNCMDDCRHGAIAYGAIAQTEKIPSVDAGRRAFCLSLAGGVLAAPAVRLAAGGSAGRSREFIRPPGSLDEQRFLERCLKCGQCMRVCPTNVIQPAGFEAGIEGLWTPVLNNRIGSSGCQLNCVACGKICPTSAIRPIEIDEKLGRGRFAGNGPVRIGTAFVDRKRCLPWAFDRPCIVCEENCPVSPKAIYTRTEFNTIRDGVLAVLRADGDTVTVSQTLESGRFATGDYYCLAGGERYRIVENTGHLIRLSGKDILKGAAEGGTIQIQVRLQKPFVDLDLCTGCGICEHECPVSGKSAVRVRPEGQTRRAGFERGFL
jgi:polyferredoxin